MGIGKVLVRLLKERGTNVHEIASKAGIKPSTLYSIIQRDSMSANVRDLWRLTHMLDITLDYFYELVQKDNGDFDEDMFDDEYAQAVKRNDGNLSAADDLFESCSEVDQEDLDFLRNDCDYYQVDDESMMPDYAPGDIIAVLPGELPDLGEDGVFIRDGKIMLRRRVSGALLALDPHVEPLAYPTKRPFEAYGTVVGRSRLRY